MGIFSAIQKGYAKVVTGTGNLILKGIGKATGKTYKTSTPDEFLGTKAGKVLSTAFVGTAAALGVAAAGAGVAAAGGARVVAGRIAAAGGAAAAGRVTTAAAGGAGVAAAGGARVVAGRIAVAAVPAAAKVVLAALKSPVKSVAIAGIVAGGGLKVVPNLFETTKKATQVAVPVLLGEKGLTSENVKDVAKVGGIALGVGALGLGAGIVAKKVLEKKEEAKQVISQETEGVKVIDYSKEFGEVGAAPVVPVTPTTEEIKPTTTSKKRKKRSRKALMPSINQRVNVVVANKTTNTGIRVNKKYLNKEIVI